MLLTKGARTRLARRALQAGAILVALAFAGAAAAAEKHVIVAVGQDITTTDPHKVSGGGDGQFFSNVFEGLYGHDLDGKLAPQLATDYTVSEDGLVWEFTLRKGVTFHNGEPFTADDVRFSWQRGIDPEVKNPRASILLAKIKDVEIVDDHKVRIHMKTPDAGMLEAMGEYWYIVPADYIRQQGNEGFVKQPVGTGPYKFVERRVKEAIELAAFKEHWGRVPGVDRVTMKIVPDPQTRVAMLQTGEADIIVNVPPHLANQVQTGQNTKTIVVPSYQNIYIGISERKPDGTWAKKEVRQALNYAVDKEAIAKKVMFGNATISAAPCHLGVLGCDIGKKPYPYDPKKAKQLLEQAGFDFSKTYRFVGLAPGRTPQSKEVTEAVAFYLNQVGVKTKVEFMEYGAWLAYIGGKDFADRDLCFWTWTDYNNDPMARLPRQVGTDGTYSWVSRPALDKKMADANKITDPAKREAHIREIFTELYEDPPFIILWTVNEVYGARKNVDWTPRAAISWPELWKLTKN